MVHAVGGLLGSGEVAEEVAGLVLVLGGRLQHEVVRLGGQVRLVESNGGLGVELDLDGGRGVLEHVAGRRLGGLHTLERCGRGGRGCKGRGRHLLFDDGVLWVDHALTDDLDDGLLGGLAEDGLLVGLDDEGGGVGGGDLLGLHDHRGGGLGLGVEGGGRAGVLTDEAQVLAQSVEGAGGGFDNLLAFGDWDGVEVRVGRVDDGGLRGLDDVLYKVWGRVEEIQVCLCLGDLT